MELWWRSGNVYWHREGCNQHYFCSLGCWWSGMSVLHGVGKLKVLLVRNRIKNQIKSPRFVHRTRGLWHVCYVGELKDTTPTFLLLMICIVHLDISEYWRQRAWLLASHYCFPSRRCHPSSYCESCPWSCSWKCPGSYSLRFMKPKSEPHRIHLCHSHPVFPDSSGLKSISRIIRSSANCQILDALLMNSLLWSSGWPLDHQWTMLKVILRLEEVSPTDYR